MIICLGGTWWRRDDQRIEEVVLENKEEFHNPAVDEVVRL
jgi:hypothetical protein